MPSPPSIARAELDARQVDFTDVTTGDVLPPVHPGEVLRQDFLEPLGLTPEALANALRVPPDCVSAIMAGGDVNAETALRLARYFGTSAGFWLNLQKSYELDVAERAFGARIRADVIPSATP